MNPDDIFEEPWPESVLLAGVSVFCVCIESENFIESPLAIRYSGRYLSYMQRD